MYVVPLVLSTVCGPNSLQALQLAMESDKIKEILGVVQDLLVCGQCGNYIVLHVERHPHTLCAGERKMMRSIIP